MKNLIHLHICSKPINDYLLDDTINTTNSPINPTNLNNTIRSVFNFDHHRNYDFKHERG